MLIGSLAAPEAIFIVENVLERQREASFVLQYFPCDVGIPQQPVLVHRLGCVAPAGGLGDGRVEHKIANGGLGFKTEVVVPKRGVLFGRSSIAYLVCLNFSKERGFEPVAVERERQFVLGVEVALPIQHFSIPSLGEALGVPYLAIFRNQESKSQRFLMSFLCYVLLFHTTFFIICQPREHSSCTRDISFSKPQLFLLGHHI